MILFAGLVFRQFVVADTSRWIHAGLSSLGHTIWSVVLFWVILAFISQHRGRSHNKHLHFKPYKCHKLVLDTFRGFLGSRHWLPLSKLTNCVLIIHPLITRLIILSMSQSFRISFSLIVSIYTYIM